VTTGLAAVGRAQPPAVRDDGEGDGRVDVAVGAVGPGEPEGWAPAGALGPAPRSPAGAAAESAATVPRAVTAARPTTAKTTSRRRAAGRARRRPGGDW
jgi:hypothetical protein